MMKKKVLVPGGTGAMGVYLVPELLKMGYQVDVVSLDTAVSTNPDLTYIQADAKDPAYIESLLKQDYVAVVDFMFYPTREQFERFTTLYLENTEHYIFLSTYRVYANEEHPIKETSPRLLDVATDQAFLQSGDYSIYKAQAEDFLRNSSWKNWTIVRPAITYSKRRFQLVTLEMDTVVRRMLEGKKLVLPEKAMPVQATMSWAGDVAIMMARLLLNKDAYGETYSVCTAEHHTWEEISKMYERIGGLQYCTVDTQTYIDILCPNHILFQQQLIYDRYYDRIMDNSKILNITGMKQSELMPLEKGLAMEFANFPKDYQWGESAVCRRMDAYLSKGKVIEL